jgi:2-polyprenyl-3-methyl-5-hydroxy-6-metoxy-1,4-benzoquinol methylase
MSLSNNCIVCGSSSNQKTYLKESKAHPNYLRCTECGFVFAYPRIPVPYQDEAEYDIHKSDVAYNARLANYEIRFNAIKKYLVNGTTECLDVGTHTGIFLQLLKSKGFNGIGIEVNRSAAEFGRQKYGVKIVSGTLEKMVGQGSYDLVTLFNVFEHFDDPLSELIHLKNLTKINGILVIEVPFIFTLQARLSQGTWHHFSHEHFWFYDKKTITKLLNSHGFKVVEAAFVPKTVTMARVFINIGYIFRLYILFPWLPDRIRNSRFYKFLDKKIINMNIADYLLVIARRVE